jgi:hypothetical protein
MWLIDFLTGYLTSVRGKYFSHNQVETFSDNLFSHYAVISRIVFIEMIK